MSWPVKTIRGCFYLLFILVPLIFLPATSELFEFNKMIVTYLITIIIAGAWVIDMILQKHLIFRRTPLDWPLIIFLISYFISLIFSIDPRTSFLGYYSRFNGGLASFVCYSLLYWAFVTFMNRRSVINSLNFSLLPTVFLVCLYGVAQHLGIDDHIWVQDVKTRVFSTLGQPNWLAAYLVALIFIPLANIITAKKWSTCLPAGKAGQLVNWLIFCLMFITLLFTKSRSGLLAFGISSAVFWGFTLFQNITPFPPLRLRGGIKEGVIKPFLVFTFLTLTLTLAFSNPLRDQYLFKYLRISQPASDQVIGPALETGGTESGNIRRIVWTGALRIWQASAKNFWLGSGPETFAMAYYQHRPVEHNTTSEWELLYNKAHNEFLNFLATTGILGLGSYLLLLGSIIYIFHLNSKGAVQIGLLSGWATILVTNFWGFSVVITNLLLFLLPALAFALNQSDNPDPKPVTSLKPWQIMAFLFSLFSVSYFLFSVSKYWLADVKYAAGQKDLRSFTSTQQPSHIISSYSNYLDSYNLNKRDPAISSELATVMAYISLLTVETDSTTSAKLAQTSLSLAQNAVASSPFHPNYYKSLSRTAIILSTIDPKYLEVARKALETAVTVSPTDPRLLYNLAVVYNYQGDSAAAQKSLSRSLLLKSDFADALALQAELATASGKINR